MRSVPPAVAGGSVRKHHVATGRDPPASAGGTDLIAIIPNPPKQTKSTWRLVNYTVPSQRFSLRAG
jgi:hypothetical protein